MIRGRDASSTAAVDTIGLGAELGDEQVHHGLLAELERHRARRSVCSASSLSACLCLSLSLCLSLPLCLSASLPLCLSAFSASLPPYLSISLSLLVYMCTVYQGEPLV